MFVIILCFDRTEQTKFQYFHWSEILRTIVVELNGFMHLLRSFIASFNSNWISNMGNFCGSCFKGEEVGLITPDNVRKIQRNSRNFLDLNLHNQGNETKTTSRGSWEAFARARESWHQKSWKCKTSPGKGSPKRKCSGGIRIERPELEMESRLSRDSLLCWENIVELYICYFVWSNKSCTLVNILQVLYLAISPSS